MQKTKGSAIINMAGLFLLTMCYQDTLFSQVLETEESKPLHPGQFEVGTGLEYQISAEGTETALPMELEYGLSERFTLLVEPVVFTTINPKSPTSTTGLGDLELTLFYQLIKEHKAMPSVSVSGEIKVPTAQNKLIGTGKTDYTPYLVASKTFGKFFTSFNFSYTFLGRPDSVSISNIFGLALGAIYSMNQHSILFAEIYGNSSAVEGTEGSEGNGQSPSIQIAELSGGEIVGAIG